MTSISASLTRPPARNVAKLLSCNEFFAALYILGCVNGLLGRLILSANYEGWIGAVVSVDINAIVLFACFAGISLLLSSEAEEPREDIRRTDIAVAVGYLGFVVLPIFAMSWVAVTGLSLYILLFAREGSSRWRGALVLLALTVPMLWSRLLFQFFANIVLDSDALLVSLFLGTDRLGNMVHFADGSGYMVVLAPCSSLANMSLAFLCWISITQWVRHPWSPTDLLWSSMTCASVIAVNVTRISLMGWSHSNYEAIHSPTGDLVTNTVMLCLMVGFSLLGVRRELSAR